MTYEEEKAIKNRYRGQKGPNGRGLCTWCGSEVPNGRRSWCSDQCVDEFRQRKERAYWNGKARRRDKGICQCCGIDIGRVCHLLHSKISADLSWINHRFWPGTNQINPYWKAFEIYRLREEYYRRLGWPSYGVAEEFDHIVELADGGENTLANLQTICSRCHKRKTAAFAARRAQDRKQKGDKQLGLILVVALLLLLCSCSSEEMIDRLNGLPSDDAINKRYEHVSNSAPDSLKRYYDADLTRKLNQ